MDEAVPNAKLRMSSQDPDGVLVSILLNLFSSLLPKRQNKLAYLIPESLSTLV